MATTPDGTDRRVATDRLGPVDLTHPPARRRRLGTVVWGLVALAGCLIGFAGSGIGGLLIAAGITLLIGGGWALAFGRNRLFRIRRRGMGAALVGAAVLVTAIGGAASGAARPAPRTPVAVPATARASVPTPAASAAPATRTPAPSSTPSPTQSRLAVPAAPGTALALLATLRVKGRAPMTGYTRTADFGPAWLDVDRNGCDTRNDILRRDLHDTTGGGCRVLSGILHDPYTGRTIHFVRGERTSLAVQIDHVVALGDAWQTGAQQLSESQRIDLANDPFNLLAVDGPTNEAKGDGDAATWLPPRKAFRCTYVAHQVSVKAAYHLWVTAAERAAMARVLATCPSMRTWSSTTSHEAVASPRRAAPPAPPTTAPKAPAGATAECRDGTWSSSQHHSGTCSRHGGVLHWL